MYGRMDGTGPLQWSLAKCGQVLAHYRIYTGRITYTARPQQINMALNISYLTGHIFLYIIIYILAIRIQGNYPQYIYVYVYICDLRRSAGPQTNQTQLRQTE